MNCAVQFGNNLGSRPQICELLGAVRRGKRNRINEAYYVMQTLITQRSLVQIQPPQPKTLQSFQGWSYPARLQIGALL